MTNIDQINPNFAKAMMLAKRELPSFVYDAVQLEGINFTLPEVQTLLDGITVGGHKLSDQQVAINQGNAWRQLFNDLEQKQFNVSDKYAIALHSIAAKEEALEWGCFRSGGVTIAGTTYLPPKAKKLSAHFAQMVKEYETINDIYDSAIFVFLSMARNQFFYDVNKRMGRFMMNGILLAKGYPAINVPVTRQLEFNSLMIDFYDSDDQVAMNAFLKSCLDPRILDIMSE